MDRFTQFPAINDDDDIHIVPWQVDAQLPSDIFALSWAILLCGFTTDENPVFVLNGVPVKANLSVRTIHPADLAVSDLSVKHTAVVLGDPLFSDDGHPPALRWTLDPTTQLGALCATGGMNAAFLYQLGNQLKQIVQEQAAQKGIQVTLSATEVPDLAISNASPSTLPGPQLLHELALRGLNDSNHAVEFLAPDGNIRCLSYHDLDRLSSELANKIAHASTTSQGIQNVVPVLLPQSVELYISWLAILKAGAAFCPLNTDAPTDRIEFILQDVAASVVVTNDALATRIPLNEQVSILTVDDLQTNTDVTEPCSESITSTDLAYVMYTSGSTGRPKGVGVSHLAATQSLLAHDDLIPPFKRFLQFASPTFDVSVFEVFFPMMRGSTLIGSEREHMLLDISHVMTTMRVDAAELTPTVAGELLRTRAAAPSLRVLLTIGEMLTRHVVDEFGQSEGRDGILHGMYGPTEAAIHCTAATHFQAKDRVNMIGKPFKTVSAYIMSLPSDAPSSTELHPLLVGQIGELVVGGPQLADGYINRPEENAKAFIDSSVYGRLYRTGDKARILPTGEIECFGRISSGQVKLRGQRIELGEIEHVITRAPGVRSAVTIVIDGNLIAFVLVTDKGTTDSGLRDACRQLLPRFMIPGEFVLVDRFPQLPSGKIDRKTLEADFIRHRSAIQASDDQPYRDEKEESIVSSVADVLGRRLSSTESLGAAGLDSLAAIRLASHLLDAGIRLSVATLLEADSVDGIWQLATSLEAASPTDDTHAALETILRLVSDAGAARVDSLGLGEQVSDIVPCSHIQQAMILETVRDNKAYCNWIELEFEPSVSSTSVKNAFGQLASHNEILRSGFVEIGLKDHSYGRFTWNTLEEHVSVQRELDYDLGLSAGHDVLNPFRVQIKEGKDHLRVLVHIHHALYDGWSWQLMLKDLRSIFCGEGLTSKPSYNVVANFFIEHKLDKSTTESSTYWRDHLQGLYPANFPTFHGNSDTVHATDKATRVLETSVSKLNEVSQHLRVSRQTIFQAAFCYILSSYIGTGDVTFGTVFSGRTLPLKGIETILGPCIRTLPTRMNLSKMQGVTDLLLAIQNMNRKSLEHGSLPLQDIKKASGINLDRSLFDTALVWQESIWSDDDQGSVFREVGAGEFLEFALLLEFEPREENIFARATYQKSVLPFEQAMILLEQIDSVASILIDNINLPIQEIPSYLPSSTLSIQHAASPEQVDLPSLASSVEMIASTDPDRVAVEMMLWKPEAPAPLVESMTYGQLNSQANGFAHLLLHVGVTKPDLIAIYLTTSLDFYVAVLGVAKAGAGLLLLPRASSDMIHSILSMARFKFCIVDSLTEKNHRLDSLKSVQLIHISYSLDIYQDFNIPYTNEGSDVIYAEVTVIENDLTENIVISRQNLQSHINALSEWYPTPTGSKMLSCLQGSGASICQAFFAWHAGMTLCSATDVIMMTRIEKACQDMNITHLHLPPMLASRIDPQAVPSVQYLLSSGEEMTPKLHRNWAGKGLHQAYSNHALAHICTIYPNTQASTYVRNIGRPLKNTSAMVVADGDSLVLLPRGAIGELCFGGDQVGRCLPDTEASVTGRFIEHPKFGRIYRTGDLGRLLPDGTLILSRSSDLAQSYSPSIDLDEVDCALMALDMIQESVSLVLNDPKLSQKAPLAVFWVSSTKCSDSVQIEEATNDLFKELTNKLPSSSLPSLLVHVDAIDLTMSYKTDHFMLRQRLEQLTTKELAVFSPKLNANDTGDSFTELEKTISITLSAVTGTAQSNIRKHTSFYRLGLDSLAAISLSRKLQESGYGRLSVSTILRHSSIAQLAAVISATTDEDRSEEAVMPAPPTVFDEIFTRQVEDEFKAAALTVQSIYPCTPLQEAMLAAESGGRSAYFNHLLLLVHTNAEDMRAAWTKMMQRQDILRTCFTQTNDKRFAYAQIVLDTLVLPWSHIETSSSELENVIKESKSKFEGLSPVNGQLPYSLTLITDSNAQKTHLLLSIHHALYDGEGIAQLLHELQLLLSSQELPANAPFRNFIDYMTSLDYGSSDEYWDQYLSGVFPTLLPTPEPAANADESASQQIHTSLNGSFISFKQQCKDLSVTPLNIFHAAWARLLSLYTDSSDVCFGNVFSCRTVPLDGADRIVGPCFNTLPIRIKPSSTATNSDIMKLSQQSNNDILPHQLSPLRRIQRRVLGDGSRLFDTLVIFQNRNTFLDCSVWEILQDEGNMGFPLICEIVPDESADNINICLHFQVSHISQAVAETIAQDFVALVEHITQYPSSQASDKWLLRKHIPRVFEQKVSKPTNSVQFFTKSRQKRPWSYQEEIVREILCNLSDVSSDNVSQDTTIFQLGLDSINAVQVSAKLRGLGYNKISSSDILEAASIDQIASLLTSSAKVVEEIEFDFELFQTHHLQSVCEQLDISSQIVQSLRPCTPVQNGMLAMFTHSHGSVYFNRMALRFPEPLDKKILKEAWIKVMAQHEMLRTGFVQLRDQQYPFSMITYYENIEVPWCETSASITHTPGVQEKHALENLHQPPWSIEVEAGDNASIMHFSALHAIYDAQSLATIFADVRAAYDGKVLATPAPITATLGPILLESNNQSESARSFWKELTPEVQPSKFPDLHPIRTDERTLLTTSIHCAKSRKALEDACRDIGVTLQAAGQAAWARLLSAYTGESNITFGTVLSGRNLSAAAQHAVFPCLVTVPTSLRIEGSNRQLLDRTLKRNALLMKNQFAPLSHVQRWLGSDEPLFDTLFVYQKFSSDAVGTDGWNIIDEETKIDYPVSVELIPHSTDLKISLSYRSDIVPVEQAAILLSQYDKFLQNTVFRPDANSNGHESVGSSLLSITPAKEAPIPTTVSLLHQFVEGNALKIPDKSAFEFAFGDTADSLQKKTWTYCEFNECGNQIAHFLQAKGAVPGGIVGICFDKCPEASMAILGIMKAGCAYLAIDPGAPISRKQFMLEDSGTKILLCNQSKMAELEGLPAIDVQALDEPGLLDGVSTGDVSLSRPIQPDDTCYCLYTSGTTGTPKGCEITHDNAVQAMLAFQRLFAGHWDEKSRWLQFASFHFDVSVLEQYWSWSVGICVTSCPRDLLFEDLTGTIQKLQITHIDLTPSLARLVHPDEVPSLCRGVFITGGEALKQEILDAWGKHGVIYNGYGPTEVTIGCTMLPRMSANDKASNIGPQFDNVGSYVFSPGTTTPVLRGSIGELCVSGPLVGKGYLNRAELTTERFQELPEFGDRIYRTGDLVRILHDGSFQFLGRIDDQVKLRGQRLEIGEINEVIKQAMPELNEVATLVITHPKQSKDQLVSFFTTATADKKDRAVKVGVRSSEDGRVLLSKIKSACRTHLPGYMVPTHIIPMTRFPLSANNKADMKVLKSIYQELSLEDIQILSSMSVGQPTDSVHEQKIISVLARFIGSSEGKVSSWSSIYELGLDSISVIAFSRSLREAGFSQAQPSIIMKYPTVSGMASALHLPVSSSVSVEAIQRSAKQGIEAFAHKNSHTIIERIGDDIEKIAPCTSLQEGIIYHYLSSSTPLYCSSFTFELDPAVNLENLCAAWGQAQREVQMLRAKFLPSPDGYAQVIMKKDALPWFLTTAGSKEEIDDLRKQRHGHWTTQLDDLSSNLWEVGVIFSPETSVMCLSIFHAIYDGNSLVLLLESVARNYLCQSKSSQSIPEFLDVLHLGPLCKDPAAKSFWKEHLTDCRNRPFAENGQVDSAPILLKVQMNLTEQVDHLHRSLNVTEQAVLHACWLLTLQQQYSFVPPLGIIASGRTIDVPEIADVIGPLFNTIPSNVQLHGLESWSDVARRCHDYHVSMIPFQYTALRDIVKWLGKNPNERLFDSLFVFQREADNDTSFTKHLWRTLDSEAQHEYPLAFEIVRNSNQSLTATIAAKSHAVSSEDAQLMLSKFEQILSTFAQDPNRELHKINGDPLTQAVANDEMNGHHEILKTPVQSNVEHTNGSLFEWTSQACTIRDVIETLAGVEPQSISENTSIFEVGLDSIDAIKISSRLSKVGIKLPVSSIMRHRTVKAMSEQLSMTNGHIKDGTLPLLNQLEKSLAKFLGAEGLLPKNVTRILPATPIQEAMVAEMSASGYKHYYNHEILELEPDVDIGRMEQAWRAVVRAHPILRTSFVEVWDPQIPVSYAQIIHGEDQLDIQTVYLHRVSVESIIDTQRSRVRNELAGFPLLSLTIAVDGARRHLVLSIAHALYDGWSINLLHEDVAKSYADVECSRPPADDILEQIIASSGDEALRFWRATLSNFTPVSFSPMEHADKSSAIVHRAEQPLAVPLSKAETFCKRHGITLQALLVACWSLVLATHVKRLDVAFGLVLSGRNVADSEHVMFPTMNTVAMRVILHGTRVELVKYVQEALLAMSEHQHFPLRRARPDTGSRALFDTLFMYQKRPVQNAQTASRQVLYKSTGGAADVEYPICAEVEGVGEDLVGRVACRGNVIGDQDTLALLGQIGDILSSIIDGPSEQTVEFTSEGVKICGSAAFQDESGQDIETEAVPRRLNHAQWLPIESKIREVLSITSGVPESSIDKSSTIFELGLDSISAIKVAALLKKQSIKLAVSDMLRAGTVENMAKAANSKQTELPLTNISPILHESLGGIDGTQLLHSHGIDSQRVRKMFPATAGQTYFLSMHILNPEVFYPEFYYLTSRQLSPEVLDRAWARVIDQTPMLRTAFVPTADSRLLPYMQIEFEAVQIPVVWHSKFDRHLVSTSLQQEFGAVPVALHACQANKGTALILQIHHALYDAVSLPHILDRLVAHCSQEKVAKPNPDLDLSQLVAFHHVHSPVGVRRQFWQKYLGQIPTAVKRGDGFGSVQQHYRPGLVSNMASVEKVAKRQGLSVQTVFLAVYARVHLQEFRAAETDDAGSHRRLTVGLYLANRSHSIEGLAESVIPTVNIVPLRLDDKLSDSNDTLLDAAHRIQTEINEISRPEYSGVSLVEIAEWTGVRIDTCINFLRLPEPELKAPSNGDAELSLTAVQREEFEDLSAPVLEAPIEINGNGLTPPGAAEMSPGLKHPSASTAQPIFQPTIDVEAAIRNGRLDFGLFAPESRLDGDTAETVIGAMQREMSALVTGFESM
ncbi:AMP-dependent synthetase/ligase [Penicillium concentricum]|uniref:Nonribosomal peptide synthetase sidC n=1 Tax=Penicillium concentricum TaxID=293559 RepID=A0A9W9V3N7_9EURO|nr:AMP-dependent synthetase/ligase [Penicillium concentricum]KAJ5365051.1 AMP-dependent synthetase/ligase [Penicillium concentricum]